jgi:hypothetical protein
MRPPAVSMVHCAVGIRQKNRHRQIIIKRELTQVHIVDIGNTHTNIPCECLSEFFTGTDNLPVKKSAINSWLTTEHHKQRLLLHRRLGPRFFQVVHPDKTIIVSISPSRIRT